MFLRAFVLVFLMLVFNKGFGQQQELSQTPKNRGGITYKTFLPVANPYDKIIKPSHNIGLNYARTIRGNHSVGLNVYYNRSKYLGNLVGAEPFYKYVFRFSDRKVFPFVKVNAGFQTSVQERWLTFTNTIVHGEYDMTQIRRTFRISPKVFYLGEEFGLEIKLGEKYILEPSLGYMLTLRNYKNKWLDAYRQDISLSEPPPGSPVILTDQPQVPPLERAKNYYYEPLTFSFGLSLQRKF